MIGEVFVAAFVALVGCCPPGVYHDDTPYYLPYAAGTAHVMVQGHFGPFGHEYELDFEMPEGTPIVAARGGTVTRARSTCPDCSCWYTPDCACCQFANFIEITHDDGTRAAYAHLKHDGVLVAVGDVVSRGQIIGLSGNTGNSTLPHLHFVVYGPDGGRLGPSPSGTMEVPFAEACGDGVPWFGWLYISANEP